jgi:uncharacterized protein YegP (UPF0339 family)
MSIRFEVKQNDQGEFFFQLLSGDDQLLLMGAECQNREAVQTLIKDVQLGSLMGHQIGAGKVSSGETFFVIKDTHGQIIAKSALFSDQMAFDNALHAVKDNACIAETLDRTAA